MQIYVSYGKIVGFLNILYSISIKCPSKVLLLLFCACYSIIKAIQAREGCKGNINKTISQ